MPPPKPKLTRAKSFVVITAGLSLWASTSISLLMQLWARSVRKLNVFLRLVRKTLTTLGSRTAENTTIM